MKKHILFSTLILLIITSVISADNYKALSGSSFNGNGNAEYPNEGCVWCSSWASYAHPNAGSNNVGSWTIDYDPDGHTVNCTIYSQVSSCEINPYTASSRIKKWIPYPSGGSTVLAVDPLAGQCLSSSSVQKFQTSCLIRMSSSTMDSSWWGVVGSQGSAYTRLTISYNELYNISGDTDCLTNVTLYENDNILEVNNLEYNNYTFEHLIEGHTYKLKFNDGHEYEFEISSNMVYDYDACTHVIYNFKESCNNLIPDSEGVYIENYGLFGDKIENFYTPSGVLDIANTSADFMYIYSDTFIGKTAWLIDPVVDDTTYDLVNPNIAWSLKVIVINESNDALIDDAMVKVDQTCYCTSGYSTRQKMTVNGTANFGDMSLQDASLFVMKSGYKICNENSTGYDAFLSGRTNFSSKTWVVKLAPSWSENETVFYEVNNKVDIHFKDVNGNRTSQILDTDAEIYLYYENNNTDSEAMTLKFQSSSTHSYFSDALSWTIAHDDIGHKTIANNYFTPWDYSYRAVIYNSSIYGWNITCPLTVRNATKETTLHYENLTTSLFFMSASDGKIDYREDMSIAAHACSNNTTLMYVDVELYKNNSLLCYKNLTANDFINADFQYWYVWNPIYEYVAGANYSVRMYGFDRTLLETDYIECVSDEITRKNKLTIIIKNRFGTNLDNAFVYLEGYGSLSTGVNSYASYEGLDNGYYRYKATKAGYDAAGWDDVTLSDNDEIRTYILTETTSDAGAANQPQKMEDDDLRNLYITLMAFLLIFVLLGGFLYVIK